MNGAMILIVAIVAVGLWFFLRPRRRSFPQTLVRALAWAGTRLLAHARALDQYVMHYRAARQMTEFTPRNESPAEQYSVTVAAETYWSGV